MKISQAMKCLPCAEDDREYFRILRKSSRKYEKELAEAVERESTEAMEKVKAERRARRRMELSRDFVEISRVNNRLRQRLSIGKVRMLRITRSFLSTLCQHSWIALRPPIVDFHMLSRRV